MKEVSQLFHASVIGFDKYLDMKNGAASVQTSGSSDGVIRERALIDATIQEDQLTPQ